MADFPFVGHASSRVRDVDERDLERALSGKPYVRVSQSRMYRVFLVRLRALTAAQRDTMRTFLANYRASTFTFYWAPTAETVTVFFAQSEVEWEKEGDYYHTEVEMWETA